MSHPLAGVAAHPLDQLSVAEVQASAAACKRYALGNGVGALRFNTVMLKVDVYRGMTCPVTSLLPRAGCRTALQMQW